MSKEQKFVIEFAEDNTKTAQYVEYAEDVKDGLVEPGNDVSQVPANPFKIVEFSEDDLLSEFKGSIDPNMEVGKPQVVEFTEESLSLSEEPSLEELVEEVHLSEGPADEESSALDSGPRLPGSTMSLADDEKDDEKEEEEEVPGTWKDDMDVRDFMAYIESAYNAIPVHDGTTIIGCERAINYLNDLNREISKALTLDKMHILDAGALDGYRVNMMNDMMTLKSHIKKLQKKIRENHGKKAADGTPMKVAGTNDVEFVKEATAARPQLVITPFERAVSGMIVNAVISSGKPFEDVYEFLKKKYALSDREELAIMQLVTDMGYPIFKDRGTYSSKVQEGDDVQGVDFIKNYFA